MEITERWSAEGITCTISIPGPKIVDTSLWPEFAVEWMGCRIPCKYLGDNIFQIGNKIWVRGREGDDYTELKLEDILPAGEV